MGTIKSIYVGGSLRNRKIIELANKIERKTGIEAFCDWIAPGEEADDKWRDLAKRRGWNYKRALRGPIARCIFEFDLFHLDRCDAFVLVLPAGKSAHLELGYMIGKGKPGFILYDKEPKGRWDVMTNFATDVFFSQEELINALKHAAKFQ